MPRAGQGGKEKAYLTLRFVPALGIQTREAFSEIENLRRPEPRFAAPLSVRPYAFK